MVDATYYQTASKACAQLYADLDCGDLGNDIKGPYVKVPPNGITLDSVTKGAEHVSNIGKNFQFLTYTTGEGAGARVTATAHPRPEAILAYEDDVSIVKTTPQHYIQAVHTGVSFGDVCYVISAAGKRAIA